MSCHYHGQRLRVSGDVEEPKNELVNILTKLVNEDEGEHINIEIVTNASPNLDSLVAGQYDLLIVDNNIKYHESVSALTSLYPEILHVLYKKNYKPSSVYELLENKKVYAGEPGSGSRKFLDDLIQDFNIGRSEVENVDIIDLFDADVIILFTGLITIKELLDLADYEFYSFGSADQLGLGTTAEAISLRHPEFKPYVLPRYIYGNVTKEPVLTLSNQALLVCRSDEDPTLIYELCRLIDNKKQIFYKISPLLQEVFTNEDDYESLIFPLHEGARRYIERDEPGFLEKHTGLIGILLTLLIGSMSGLYTVLNYRAIKKKNIIDKYYAHLIDIRERIDEQVSGEDIDEELSKIKDRQNETIALVIDEKLSANESYLVYMRLVDLVSKELKEKKKDLKKNLS